GPILIKDQILERMLDPIQDLILDLMSARRLGRAWAIIVTGDPYGRFEPMVAPRAAWIAACARGQTSGRAGSAAGDREPERAAGEPAAPERRRRREASAGDGDPRSRSAVHVEPARQPVEDLRAVHRRVLLSNDGAAGQGAARWMGRDSRRARLHAGDVRLPRSPQGSREAARGG